MKLDLDQILTSSSQLNDMGSVYAGINTKLKAASSANGDMFQTGGLATAYSNAVNELWSVCADTQDAFNGSAAVLVHYVNAVCAEDDTLSDQLSQKANELNNELDEQEQNNGYEDGQLGSRLPEVDPNGDPPVEVPDYDEAEQPPEEGN